MTTFDDTHVINISRRYAMYNEAQIKDMIFSYRWRKNILLDEGYSNDSNGIAQYGIESTLPKAQGVNTDKVQSIATRNCVLSRVYDEHLEVITFIDKYEHCIDNDMNLNILYLFKKGKKSSEIRKIMNIGRDNLSKRINDIVHVYTKQQEQHEKQKQHKQHKQQEQQHQH